MAPSRYPIVHPPGNPIGPGQQEQWLEEQPARQVAKQHRSDLAAPVIRPVRQDEMDGLLKCCGWNIRKVWQLAPPQKRHQGYGAAPVPSSEAGRRLSAEAALAIVEEYRPA